MAEVEGEKRSLGESGRGVRAMLFAYKTRMQVVAYSQLTYGQ